MRLTFPHYYATPTGEALDGAASWDAIRSTSSAFGLPLTREEWAAQADGRTDLRQRAEAVAAIAAQLGADVVASYGVGTGLLEHHLASMVPKLVCGDFAPATTRTLAGLAPELHVEVHDLRTDPPFTADLHVLHRVDTEFSNREWRRILAHFHEPVLLVMSGFLSPAALRQEVSCRFRGGHRAGWMRTRSSARAMLRHGTAEDVADLGGLDGFLVRP